MSLTIFLCLSGSYTDTHLYPPSHFPYDNSQHDSSAFHELFDHPSHQLQLFKAPRPSRFYTSTVTSQVRLLPPNLRHKRPNFSQQVPPEAASRTRQEVKRGLQTPVSGHLDNVQHLYRSKERKGWWEDGEEGGNAIYLEMSY